MVTLGVGAGDGLAVAQTKPAVTIGLDDSLYELGLPIRVVNALENSSEVPDANGHVRQIRTVRELLNLRPGDILAIPNLGETMLKEIYACLASRGYRRSGEKPPPLTFQERMELARGQRQTQLRQALGCRGPA